MGQSDDVGDSTFMKHQDLCQKLNVDASAAKEAWESFQNLKQHFTLEGDQLQWLGCALYVACRKAVTPTVGKNAPNIQGNCVSLTKLLKLCNLPLGEFFDKSKCYADMCHMPKNFGARIEQLERKFFVSSVIFKKYKVIFKYIFKSPSDEVTKITRSRRNKGVPCTPLKLFEFCWSFFICIKSEFREIGDDLVNSCHLLLVCCDLMFNNALLANRKDLFNLEFPGLPENFNDENFTPPKSPICILSMICEQQEALVDIISVKAYALEKYVTKLFDDKDLRGDKPTYSGILDALNFDGNSKAINKIYEQNILKFGELDERIFLDCSTNVDSSPTKMMNDFQEQFQSKKHQLEAIHHLAPPTPLTGRKYLKSKETTSVALSSNPIQSYIRLQTLLLGCQPLPSENLTEIFKNCSESIHTFVKEQLKKHGEKFCESYASKSDSAESSSKSSDSAENSGLDFGKKRLQTIEKLFYKMLELFLKDEESRKPNFDPVILLQNAMFIQCLFACCCEIVIFSYQNKDKTFPWILKALELPDYYFFRVIEVAVRVCVDQFSRDMVKHLNSIEESILASSAWKSSSPLWLYSGNDIPSFVDVALPGTFDLIDPNTPGQLVSRRIALDRGVHHDVTQSPISSASERFQSPGAQSGIIKKRLFTTDTKAPAPAHAQSILKVGNPNLLSRLGAVSEGSNNHKNSNTKTTSSTGTVPINRPRRHDSLALFFRKFYILSTTRMKTICDALDITDLDIKRKIWTIFEYSVTGPSELMKDRHLDQLLMSAVYVICKLGKIEKNTFTEIMRCYRLQPQAESHIYRSVLISTVQNKEEDSSSGIVPSTSNQVSNAAPSTPSDMAATSRIFGSEERGDLIKFYNTNYVPAVKDFAKKLGLTEGSIVNLTLSPLPRVQPISNNSPVRRVTSTVMTRVLDPKEIVASPAPHLQYCFHRSPAKDLESINKMVTSIDPRKFIGKRLLSDDMETTENEPVMKKITSTTCITRKLENIIGDRRTQNL